MTTPRPEPLADPTGSIRPGGSGRAVRPGLGAGMVLSAGALFAVNGTVSKLILQAGVDAPHLTALRSTGACLGVVLLLAVLPGGLRRLRVNRRELPLLVAYGLTVFCAVPMLYFVSISRLPIGIGLLFEYTSPLLVALWVRVVQRHPVRRRLWFGLGLAIAGLACVAEVWGQLRLDGLGLVAGLGAAVLLAAYYLIGARTVASRDPLSLTGWGYAVGALTCAVVAPWWSFPFPTLAGSTEVGELGGPVPVWLLCLYLVPLGSIAPYLLVVAALRHLPATSAGILGMIEPVLAAGVAWVSLGERLNPLQLAGGAMVLTGVSVAETARVPLGDAPGGRAPSRRAPADRQDGGMPAHPNVQIVQDALDAAGTRGPQGEPCRIQVLPEAAPTAAAAAAALGVEVGQIANSLIFSAGDDPVLILTSGAHRVDPAKVAALLGVARLRRASAEFVREHTGQPIGGVAPLGHPKPVRTLVDQDLAGYDEIWAAGGIPHAVFAISYAELVRVTDGSPAQVA